MLNKQEKADVCELIASWEWTQVGSSSEAAALSRASESLRFVLKIDYKDPELMWYRAWTLAQLASVRNSDAKEEQFIFALVDMCEENYSNVLILCEGTSFDPLIEAVKARL